MKTFKFSLQALLTLREQQEQTALQAYGKALNAQERASSLLESTRAELREAQAYVQERLFDVCNATELAQLHDWCDSIAVRSQECEHQAKVTRNKARLAFTKLLGARHATAVLMKLQEAQKRRHHREQRRQEQKLLDDLAGRRSPVALLTQSTRNTLWN